MTGHDCYIIDSTTTSHGGIPGQRSVVSDLICVPVSLSSGWWSVQRSRQSDTGPVSHSSGRRTCQSGWWSDLYGRGGRSRFFFHACFGPGGRVWVRVSVHVRVKVRIILDRNNSVDEYLRPEQARKKFRRTVSGPVNGPECTVWSEQLSGLWYYQWSRLYGRWPGVYSHSSFMWWTSDTMGHV